MKKAILLFVLAISIQTINAHPGANHAHETPLHEWAWVLLPAIAALGLIWKYRKKSLSGIKK